MGGIVDAIFGGNDSTAESQQVMSDAARESNALQKQIYEESVARAQPFYQAGLQGLSTLQDRLGLTPGGTGDLLQTFGMDQFQADPGYQFRQQEGEKAIERAASARGNLLSPAAMKDLARFNQGLADQAYNEAFDRYNVGQGNIFNRLAAITGIGQQQTDQLGAIGQNYGQNIANTNISLANAQAAANQARDARSTSMFNTLIGAGATLGGAALIGGAATPAAAGVAMSDLRTKENVHKVGSVSDYIGLYEFNYKGDDKRYVGVIAQEVKNVMPDAVIDCNGVLAVNYDKLGVKMVEVN